MNQLDNKVVVITGAGSGIGRELALLFAKEGASIAISDIDDVKLNQTITDCRAPSNKVYGACFDVASLDSFEQFKNSVIEAYGHVDIVINNAGVALAGYKVEETEIKDFEWLMGINFWGMVYGTQLFLPHLRERQQSALVNISSVFGLAGIALNSAYCASKFAIRGYTESLRMEAMIDYPHVKIHSVHPGGIDTNIAKDARWNQNMSEQEINEGIVETEKIFITSPRDAAHVIMGGIRRKKERILIGKDAKALDRLVRLMPTGYTSLTLKKVEKHST